MTNKLHETDLRLKAAVQSLTAGKTVFKKKFKNKQTWKKKRKLPRPVFIIKVPSFRPKKSKKGKTVPTIQSILFKKLSFLKFFWYSQKQLHLVRSKLNELQRLNGRHRRKRKNESRLVYFKTNQLYFSYYFFLLGYQQYLKVPKIPYLGVQLTKQTSKKQYKILLKRYWALSNLEQYTKPQLNTVKFEPIRKTLLALTRSAQNFARITTDLTKRKSKETKITLKRILNLFIKCQTKMLLKKKFRKLLQKKRYLSGLRTRETRLSKQQTKPTSEGKLKLKIVSTTPNKKKKRNKIRVQKSVKKNNFLKFCYAIKKLLKRTPQQEQTFLREYGSGVMPPQKIYPKKITIRIKKPTYEASNSGKKKTKNPSPIKIQTFILRLRSKKIIHPINQSKFLFAWRRLQNVIYRYKKQQDMKKKHKSLKTSTLPVARVLLKIIKSKKPLILRKKAYPNRLRRKLKKQYSKIRRRNRFVRRKQYTARRSSFLFKKKLFLKKASSILLLKKLNNLHIKHLIKHKLTKKLYTFKVTTPFLKKISNLFKAFYSTSQIQFFFFFRLFTMMNKQFRKTRISFYKLKKDLYKISHITELELFDKKSTPVLFLKKLAPIRFLKRVFYKSLKQRYYTRRFFKNHELLPIILNCLFKRSSTYYLLSFIGLMLFKFKKHYGVLTHINRFLNYFFRLTNSKAPITGLKYIIRGRVNGAPRKKNKIYSFGINKATTFKTGLDYTQLSRDTRYGTFGLKMWRYF